MKRKLLLGLLPALLAMSVTGCGGDDEDSGEKLPENVVVTFYIDFNQPNSDESYATQTIKQGEKVTAPATPTEAPFKEFPVFLGWSQKEVIQSKDDLWNFDSTITSKTGTFSIYGIWVAKGES